MSSRHGAGEKRQKAKGKKPALTTHTAGAENAPTFSTQTQTGVPVFSARTGPAIIPHGRGAGFWEDVKAAADAALNKLNWKSIDNAANEVANRIEGI